MIGVIIVAIAISFTLVAYIKDITNLYIFSVAVWVVLGVYMRTLSTATWDVPYAMFFLSIGIGITTAIHVGMSRRKPEPEDVVMTPTEQKAYAMFPDDEASRQRYIANQKEGTARQEKEEEDRRNNRPIKIL